MAETRREWKRSEWSFDDCYGEEHCRPHDPGPEPLWNESTLLHWVDLERGVGGFHRLGVQPNRGTTNYQVGVFTHDGLRFRRSSAGMPLRGDERREDGFSIDDLLRVGNSDGLSHWLVSDPDCEVDLQLEEFLPRIRTIAAWGFENEAVREDAADHYEVAGRLRGRVCIGDEDFEIDCLGYRDHSWGNRSWGFSNHRWFCGSFGSDFSFSVATAVSAPVGYFQGGYVARDGVIDPMRWADVLVELEDDGITARGGRVAIETERFGRFDFEVEAMDCVLLESDHHIGCETLGRVRCGDRVGSCDLELSNNPRGGTEAPPVILGAPVAEGLSRRPSREGGGLKRRA